MNIILHESPFIDSIYYVPVEMYTIEKDFHFRAPPSVHEHIILNQNCAVITFAINGQVFEYSSNVVCGKFTHPPKINVLFKNHCKKLTVIRINACGMFKLTDIPMESLVNSITAGSTISIDLSDDKKNDESIAWIEAMIEKEVYKKSYEITRNIIHYIDENFSDLPSTITKEIACRFGLSESTLLRYFKKYIGMNLSTYVLTLRRKKMIQSLCNEKYGALSVQEHGYYDQSHFLNDFKRLYGMTLKEYFQEMKRLKHRSHEFTHFLHECGS
jgi:AraC-like DNA-binding protein